MSRAFELGIAVIALCIIWALVAPLPA